MCVCVCAVVCESLVVASYHNCVLCSVSDVQSVEGVRDRDSKVHSESCAEF